MTWEQKRRTPADYIHPAKQRRILTTHAGICHLCGHGGADQVDHVIAWAEWTRTDLSVHDASNLRPAHGTPCPTCGRSCHEDKTKAEAARGRARKLSKLKYPQRQHPGLL